MDLSREQIFENVLSYFRIEKRNPDGSAVLYCPAHKDDTASLSAKMGDRKILLYDHGHCSLDNILAAAGLKPEQLYYDYYESNNNRYKKQTAGERYLAGKYPKYTIYDLCRFDTGEYSYSKIRYYPDWAKGKKQFAVGYWDDVKERFTDRRGCLKDRPHHELAVFGDVQLIKQCIGNGTTVYYTEGEKDCKTMRKLGYISMTQGSCTGFHKELVPLLKGINLVILADNDPGGQSGADELRELLLPYANSVRVVTPCKDFLALPQMLVIILK